MKILIIEDEASLAYTMREYLIGEGHVCEWVSTTPAAEEKIGVYDYDCVLVDIMLPGQPFHWSELNARLKSVMRRRQGEGSGRLYHYEIEWVSPSISYRNLRGKWKAKKAQGYRSKEFIPTAGRPFLIRL